MNNKKHYRMIFIFLISLCIGAQPFFASDFSTSTGGQSTGSITFVEDKDEELKRDEIEKETENEVTLETQNKESVKDSNKGMQSKLPQTGEVKQGLLLIIGLGLILLVIAIKININSDKRTF